MWLFSSGPIGDPPKPEEDPVDVPPIMEQTAVREHFLFVGKVDKKTLSFGERGIVGALNVSEGDFRGWGREPRPRPRHRRGAEDQGLSSNSMHRVTHM